MAKQRSVATWIGIGCAASVALATVTVGGCFVFLYSQAKRFERDMENPAARTARVLDVLSTDSLPQGYHALAAFKIPLLAEVAVLTDRAPDADGNVDGFDERGFVYTRLLRLRRNNAELRDYFEGRTDDPQALRRNGIRLDAREIIGRGTVRLPGRNLMYVAQRGDVGVQGGNRDGIAAIVWIDCAGDERVRIGVWFGPDPDPDQALDQIDLTGTPADETALRAFMEPFQLCG